MLLVMLYQPAHLRNFMEGRVVVLLVVIEVNRMTILTFLIKKLP